MEAVGAMAPTGAVMVIGAGAGAVDLFTGSAVEADGAFPPVRAVIAIGAGAGALTARRSLLRA